MNKGKIIKEKLESDIFTKLSSVNRKDRITALIFGIVVFLFSFVFFGFIIGSLISILMNKGSVLYWGYVFKPGLLVTLLISGFITYCAFTFFIRRPLTNKEMDTDERGVTFMKHGVHGTGRWMSDEEVKYIFKVSRIENTDEIIYGQLKGTESGRNTISYKNASSGASKNKNTMIFGASGSGKSYTFVRNNIMQSIKRGEPFVVTDPKGELYTSLAELARNRGYEVYVLNTADPEYSNYWNCLNETINPITERLDSTRLNEFSKIFMNNSSDGNEEQFWFDSAKNLLNASIAYTSWIREKAILEKYDMLLKRIKGEGFRELYTMRPFSYYRNIIKEEALKGGYVLSEIENILEVIEKEAPEYNLGKVFENLIHFKEIEPNYLNLHMPDNHPGVYSYRIYQNNESPTAKTSALTGIQLKLSILGDEKMKRMLSRDEIKVRDISKKKTAVFVIMQSGPNSPAKPITSLFFSFFFKDQIEEYNRFSNIESETGEINPCHPVLVMLDEFASIGVIGGDPKSFADTMSIVRSSKLYVQIIIQDLSQLNAMYGEDNMHTIASCCATKLSLGVNDELTAEFISFLTGVATVLSEKHKERSTAINADAYTSDIQFTTARREVLTPDEIMRLKDVLIVRQNEQPLVCSPLPYTAHPLYKEINYKSIYSSVKPIDIYERETPKMNYDFKVYNMIEALGGKPFELKLESQSSEETKPVKSKDKVVVKKTRKKKAVKKDDELNLFDLME